MMFMKCTPMLKQLVKLALIPEYFRKQLISLAHCGISVKNIVIADLLSVRILPSFLYYLISLFTEKMLNSRNLELRACFFSFIQEEHLGWVANEYWTNSRSGGSSRLFVCSNPVDQPNSFPCVADLVTCVYKDAGQILLVLIES